MFWTVPLCSDFFHPASLNFCIGNVNGIPYRVLLLPDSRKENLSWKYAVIEFICLKIWLTLLLLYKSESCLSNKNKEELEEKSKWEPFQGSACKEPIQSSCHRNVIFFHFYQHFPSVLLLCMLSQSRVEAQCSPPFLLKFLLDFLGELLLRKRACLLTPAIRIFNVISTYQTTDKNQRTDPCTDKEGSRPPKG